MCHWVKRVVLGCEWTSSWGFSRWTNAIIRFPLMSILTLALFTLDSFFVGLLLPAASVSFCFHVMNKAHLIICICKIIKKNMFLQMKTTLSTVNWGMLIIAESVVRAQPCCLSAFNWEDAQMWAQRERPRGSYCPATGHRSAVESFSTI